MPKRRKKSAPPGPRLLLLLFGLATIVFLGGEFVRWLRSDSGALAIERVFGWGDSARLTQIMTRQVRRGLSAVNVARDSVRETAAGDGHTSVRWRVGLSPEASLIQANYAITTAVRQAGGRVFAGREKSLGRGASEVLLVVGVGGQRTHEIELVRGARPDEKSEAHPARVAVVIFGFGDDEPLARQLMAMPRPFAVAIPPDTRTSAALFRDAHAGEREVVLHLPLEPINYPQVSPGPGTLLVTMKPARLQGELRREITQARPVVAVANLMGSLATQDMTVMTAIYEELRRERLPFVHLAPVPGAVCKPLASQLGVAYEEPDAVLETEPRDPKGVALARRWKALLKAIPAGGQRVIWVHVGPATRGWLDQSLDPRRLEGVSLVPLSALLKRPPAL